MKVYLLRNCYVVIKEKPDTLFKKILYKNIEDEIFRTFYIMKNKL